MRTNEVGQSVGNFYDEFGWKRDEATGHLNGSLLHEDLDERTQSYWDNNEMRYRPYIGAGGRFFLDAGCGAKPRSNLAQDIQWHVCVDISILGLREAREQIGDSGIYVLADLASLPFKEDSFDGALLCHCLYHVEKELQFVVLEETYRATKRQKNILVFYSSRYNLISFFHRAPKLLLGLANLMRGFPGRFGKGKARLADAMPPLYSYPHNPFRLARAFNKYDVSCLSSLSNYDTALLRRLHLFNIVVPVVIFLERRFPHFMAYIGKYTCIRIQKTD